MADKEGPLSGLEGCSVDRKTKKPDKRFRLTILDAAAILVSAGAIFLSSLGAVAAAGKPEAIISDGSKNEWVYPLDEDRHVEVTGPLGITVVHIHSGEVCIESSPCPNKTCVAAGDISKPGQWVACLPNQVFVRIEGGPEHGDEIDAHSW